MDECLDSHGGETFCRIGAWLNGEIVGELRYSHYDGQAWIKDVFVERQYRRQGIATALYEKLIEDYGEDKINHSMTTEDGTAWKKSLREIIQREIRKIFEA